MTQQVHDSYIPLIEIRGHFREVERPPFIEDFLGERLWRGAGAPGGVRRGFVRQALSDDTIFIDDPLRGQVPFRSQFLHHDYKITWNDRGLTSWEQMPTQTENTARQTAISTQEDNRDALFDTAEFSDADRATLMRPDVTTNERDAIIDAAFAAQKLSVRQVARLKGTLTYIVQLQTGGTGFLKEVYDLFGIGQENRCILWDFPVPNIPKTLLSAWECAQDQWQTFRLHRSDLSEEQAVTDFELGFTNGVTQYTLVFRKEEGVEFRHYRNMRPSERSQLETRLETVLNTGRLTPDDMLAIAELQKQISVIKANSTPADPDAKQLIAIRQTAIKQIHDAKSGLTDARRAEREVIEKKLYYDTFPISLQEDARSLFNTILDITFSFHRKGYIGIRIGRSRTVYVEIKGITKTLGYGTMLPRGCRVMVRSWGGKFSLAHGNPDFETHTLLYGQPFSVPYELGATTTGTDGRVFLDSSVFSLEIDGVGVGAGNAAPADTLAFLPGCNIKVRLERLQPLEVVSVPPSLIAAFFGDESTSAQEMVIKPAIYRVCIDSYSQADTKTKRCHYSPEIYRGSIYVQGGTPEPLGDVVWNSLTQGHPISDIQIEGDDDLATLYEIYLENSTRKPANLPALLDGSACSISTINTRTKERATMLACGIVKSPGKSDLARVVSTPGGGTPVLQATPRAGTKAKFDIRGLEAVLDRPVRYQLIGNNRPPTAYVRDLIMAHGIHAEFVAQLPATDVAGLSRLPKVSAGQPADIKPEIGASLFNYIRGDVVGRHCPGWRFRVDPLQHCGIEPIANGERPDLAYSQYLPSAHPLAILGPLHFWQDTNDYYSEYLILGAFDPGRGERISSYSRRYEASQRPDSAYFTGTDYLYIAPPDESLKSQTKCDLFARTLEAQKGLPPIYTAVPVWWRPDLRTGLVPRIEGIRFVIVGIQRSGLDVAGQQQATLTLRLAEEVGIV